MPVKYSFAGDTKSKVDGALVWPARAGVKFLAMPGGGPALELLVVSAHMFWYTLAVAALASAQRETAELHFEGMQEEVRNLKREQQGNLVVNFCAFDVAASNQTTNNTKRRMLLPIQGNALAQSVS